MMVPKAPFGHTIFCDDIREEVLGKFSLIGVYGGEISVAGLPATVPKLGIAVRYFEEFSESRVPVILRITAPGDDGDVVVVEANLGIDVARRVSEAPSLPHSDDAAQPPLRSIMANIVVAPFVLHRTGRIRARIYIGGEQEEVRIGALAITTPRQTSPIGPSET